MPRNPVLPNWFNERLGVTEEFRKILFFMKGREMVQVPANLLVSDKMTFRLLA